MNNLKNIRLSIGYNLYGELIKLSKVAEERVPVWRRILGMSQTEAHSQCVWEVIEGRYKKSEKDPQSFTAIMNKYNELLRLYPASLFEDDLDMRFVLSGWKIDKNLIYQLEIFRESMICYREDRKRMSLEERRKTNRTNQSVVQTNYLGESFDELGDDVIKEFLQYVSYDNGNWASICLVNKRWNQLMRQTIDPHIMMYGVPIIDNIVEGRMMDSLKFILSCNSYEYPHNMFAAMEIENWMDGFLLAFEFPKSVGKQTSDCGKYLFQVLSRGNIQNFERLLRSMRSKIDPIPLRQIIEWFILHLHMHCIPKLKETGIYFDELDDNNFLTKTLSRGLSDGKIEYLLEYSPLRLQSRT